MKEKNKIYTAEEITRYHSGIMPADEMHALEKAALEDPFLADALEGYMHAPEAGKDVAELKNRLAEKRKSKNIFSLSSFNGWWRIAALFIIMAGAGYFFYRMNYFDKEKPLAKNEIKVPVEKKDSVQVKNDTSILNDVAFENQQAATIEKKEKKITLQPARAQVEKKESVSAQKFGPPVVNNSTDKSKDALNADSTYFRKSNEYDVLVAKEYELKGKVTDEKGNAIPFANISDKAGNKITVTDTTGSFSLRSQDSNVTAIVSASGYASKSFALKKDMQPTIAMNKTNAELNEVVVIGDDKRKQLKAPADASKALNGKVAGVQMTSAWPQPSGGEERFNSYLREKSTPVFNENNERLTGEVTLSFTINKKGRPKNIKVVKSSCTNCEQEAMKLLENGPDWNGKPATLGTVVIKF